MTPRDGAQVRAYRSLLHAYPTEFRTRFGDEMTQLFADRLRDAREPGAPVGPVRTWFRTLVDLVVTALTEHVGKDRKVGHSMSKPPSNVSRALGLAGVVGGVVLLAAFVVNISSDLNTVRLGLFNLGAIAVVVAVHRLQAPTSPRLSLAVAGPAIAANAWYLVMVIIAIGRPQPPVGDPDFRLVWFFAGAAMWWADAAFGFVALRLGVVGRWGALALTVGSVLAFLGMDRLELVAGPFAAFFVPLALGGFALNGLGWILLGLNVARRANRRAVAAG